MKTLQTSDIVLAAFLKTKGYKLSTILKAGNKGTFVFDNVDQLIINEYDLGSGLVEPKAFNNEIKALTTAARRN